ncbi:MAG: GGDEF domain-containing protein [Anaerolineales bacterium]
MANRDDLTGVYSRRYFLELSHLELQQSRHFGHPLSLLIFDIDYFKRVNDEFGHPVGDEVLRAVTRVCRRCIRVTDLLGRYGGDEFVVLFPETSMESVRFVAERLRREVEGLLVRAKGSEIRCTISIGISGLEPGMKDVDEMIEAADEALYAAKKAGRNSLWWESQARSEGSA